MNTELTNLEKIRRLRWNVAGSALNAIFCFFTFFGSVFVLFLSELHLDKTRIGFLLSLMPLCGLIALFIAPKVARFGFKRTYLIFWSLRNLAGGMLLLTPYVIYVFPHDNTNVVFLWVAGTVLFFAFCRAVGEIAYNPWQQEFIPDHIRGKFGAVNSIVATIISIAAMLVASYVIGHYTGLGRYMVLIAAGTVAGIVSIRCYAQSPGGLPIQAAEAQVANFKGMMASLKDRNFRFLLIGLALVLLGSGPLFSFIPLFMKEQVGLTSGKVVLLDIGSFLGVLLSCYLWGWASDRYGSKPIMLSGLFLMMFLPIFWFIIPRHFAWSPSLAFLIALFSGVGVMGWNTGFGRYLFVSAVPEEKKTAYLAVFYAWAGLVGGTGPLLAGRLLDYCHSFSGKVLFLTVDPFTPLFVGSFFLFILAWLTMNIVQADGAMPVRKFVGMFLHGNPLMALESLLRYGWALEEADRVSLTQRLGDAKNPLSGNELIEALGDPSFSVRYEAIVSVSRLPADPKLIDALLLVLVGNEPDLSVAAAWALGKLGDKSAILPLRETMLSEFSLLQAHSTRALAKLGDKDSIPNFMEKLRTEPNDKLRLAYAAALGMLRARESTGDVLALLKNIHDPILASELALALARIVGREGYYIQLWRATRKELGTAVAQTLIHFEKEFSGAKKVHGEIITLTRDCAARFAQNELVQAVALLSVLVRKIPTESLSEPSVLILRECAERLTESGPSRCEYVLLALHTLNETLSQR
ncbi:MAG: MFS transporter [Phycisphaerae bacterium]